MSLTLDSLAVDDQVSTPTPGSPHPYIPVDNHDRLNSIQLSSDASGELSVAHSPRSFLDVPGEALSELRNARNPPWLHGLTGTPPGLLGLHPVDRAGRWVEDARRLNEQPLDLAAHANLARLSLGHGLIPPGNLTHLSPRVSTAAFLGRADLISGVSKVGTKIKASPFDKATNLKDKRIDVNVHRSIDGSARQSSPDGSARQSSPMFKSNGGQSGDVSSEEEEAWPMPETPFMSQDVWNDPNHKGLAKSAKFDAGNQPNGPVHPTIPVELHKVISDHRKNAHAGGRANAVAVKNMAKEGERRIGRCKMYNCDKGVGFLIDDRLDQVPHDVKIHWTDIYSDQEFKSLAKGEVVEYTLNITANGFSASYVTGPGGRPVMGAEQAIVQASRQTSYKLFKAGALPVKTYRSKWETILSPVTSDKSPSQPANNNSVTSRSVGSTRSIPKLAESKSEVHSTLSSTGFRYQNHAGKVTAPSAEPAKGPAIDMRKLGSNDSALLNPEHLAFNHQPAISGPALNPMTQFNTPGWNSFRSPLNYLQSPSSLVHSFSSSHTPLPALSHSVLTPLSTEAGNPLFHGGYTPHHVPSSRSPTVAFATPSESSNPFLAHRLLNPSQLGMNPTDLHSFLAERQLLLQQQALLMSMYQSKSQPTPSTTIPTLQQLAVPNKPHSGPTADGQQYLGAYDRAGLNLDAKFPYFGLLPPIALPVSKEAPKLSDLLPHRSTGPWRAGDLSDLKVDFSAGLRANAEAFKPARSNSPGAHPQESQAKCSTEQASPEIPKKIDGPVYQIPGRRSVSDPASGGISSNKKASVLVNSQSTRISDTSAPTNALKSSGDKSGSTKRVTFSEQPTRRVVSHGEVAGAPVHRSNCSEDNLSEAGEESIDLTSFDSGYINLSNPKLEQYSTHLEDIRNKVVGDVKSVDLAMERLREAARPRRFSIIKDPSTTTIGHPGSKELASPSTMGNGTSGLVGNNHADSMNAEHHTKLSLMIQEVVPQIPSQSQVKV